MRKAWLSLLLLFTLLLSACGNAADDNKKNNASPEEKKPETITYQSENGEVEVPADPKRVVVLSTFAGHVLALDVPIVGVDSWSKMNPLFEEKLKDAEVVTDEDIEKIMALKPDLIIGLSNTKNVDKLSKIAPTVTFTYGKVDYLTQFLEIGKLLNKEKEAKAWIDDFKQRAQQAGEEIRAKIGENATVTVAENFDKQLYVFGNNWARGTEILYQEMKLKMPKAVEEQALKPGYYAVSLEALPQFVGDYLILSKNGDNDTSFMETNTFKNIPAVKNGHMFVADAKAFYFNDPITLDYQLDFFKKHFLGQ
ncbi:MULTISPECIES: iron-hydroxamate ABC transporter substrate-binding protein [Geobacillus]|jgi:iron complex transport system substrate-binding protein|uniref:Iron-hydroxamate ABC transporter substrate-binding protein n=1 Tax=Geobacillus thermodenitrificans TaxID=33940 RepID=A0ABY9QGC1_GEOTD|nr:MULTISPECIES: iron-hydroxamate ABC transporter substrate-binding protein [Geobacillus]ARA97986.1 ABC transporter substrate-binding protein [Geobacillus thermodenitrificans]ARP41218.1 Iron(3+)-hydroxamate-binding protein YxeB [Geobacillus thermodenitrificans]ATO37341.1 ABC transporter substrate-binding protein [Geobacillus thermodenitrificans]MED3716910.1 iron-hydroxamate ABC transporter substrate-binding protein [Geobacillus thermodenitrificans]MED3904359.1 iron-hydroxamate ABC transporter 